MRGYLSGSGWKHYRQTGKLFEYDLPVGLQESDRLPEPLFTPTTKAASGHDMPIDCADAAQLIGADLFNRCVTASGLYRMGAERAAAADLILADTKFEFGTDAAGELYLIDEVLTPDSSRFWPKCGYAPGGPQPSFDKQFVRDYLEGLDWDRSSAPTHTGGAGGDAAAYGGVHGLWLARRYGIWARWWSCRVVCCTRMLSSGSTSRIVQAYVRMVD